MNNRIAIVIPYYQKQQGILSKAIRSVLAQTGVSDWHCIIVDDASPVPARSELASIIDAHAARITIIEQANAGPAAARNKALENIPAGTQYVAFLDSDDEWTDEHLANALTALEQGYDFYFTDHYQLNQTVSAFKRAKRIQVEQHRQLSGNPHLHAYEGDMFDQILRGNIIGTSTVVYRYASFPQQRFREEFVYAGEDYLFWLDLSRATPRIAFSDLIECKYGEGVNIFAGSGWGTEKSLIRLHHEMKYRKAVARLFPLNAQQALENRRIVRGLRKSFVADVLHRLMHRKPMDGVLTKQFDVDPLSFVNFVPLAISVLLRR
ncbi:MAG: glycosyltransferase [Betaproteobacteria bacterium]|nr:glycosyltransferase [Betaproteobacteria bacterium]